MGKLPTVNHFLSTSICLAFSKPSSRTPVCVPSQNQTEMNRVSSPKSWVLHWHVSLGMPTWKNVWLELQATSFEISNTREIVKNSHQTSNHIKIVASGPFTPTMVLQKKDRRFKGLAPEHLPIARDAMNFCV